MGSGGRGLVVLDELMVKQINETDSALDTLTTTPSQNIRCVLDKVNRIMIFDILLLTFVARSPVTARQTSPATTTAWPRTPAWPSSGLGMPIRSWDKYFQCT